MGLKLTALVSQLTAWYPRRDNPNQVTAAQADTYTKSQMDQTIAKMTPKGVLPIAYFGDCTDLRTTTIPVTIAQTTITYPETPVMLAGTDYRLLAGSLDIKGLTSDWANRTGYLFITRSAGNLKWIYRPEIGSESGATLRVAEVTCDASRITACRMDKVFLLGLQRMMG